MVSKELKAKSLTLLTVSIGIYNRFFHFECTHIFTLKLKITLALRILKSTEDELMKFGGVREVKGEGHSDLESSSMKSFYIWVILVNFSVLIPVPWDNLKADKLSSVFLR